MGRKSREKMTGSTDDDRITRAVKTNKFIRDMNQLFRTDPEFRSELIKLLNEAKDKKLTSKEVQELLEKWRERKAAEV